MYLRVLSHFNFYRSLISIAKMTKFQNLVINKTAVRRMAAKKGSQIQFQIDVTTQEDWNKLLEKSGLTIVDVYSEWCGPCTAMISSLKKLKVEIGSDYLHFALAKANAIMVLQRFQNKSEPTWMFIASGYFVNLLFGVDAPALIQLIKLELKTEIKALEQKTERKWVPFEELTETEKKRELVLAKKNENKLLYEQEKLELKKNIIRERSLVRLAKMIPTHSCIIYFPHMVNSDGTCVVAQKMMYLNDIISTAVIDQIVIQMNESMIDQVFFKCPIFKSFIGSMKENLIRKPVLVQLLQITNNDETFANISPSIPKLDNELQTVEQKLTKIVYGTENLTGFSEHSIASEFIVLNENGETLPPMWTPTQSISKAAAIEVFFPRKIEFIGYVPEELPPPQLIIIYDANKASNIFELIKTYSKEVYQIGFFSSVDPQNAKLLCRTYEEYSNLNEEEMKFAKMVISLKKGNTEDILLEFSQVIPLYISPNEKIGTEESEQFFPFDYHDNEEISVNNEAINNT